MAPLWRRRSETARDADRDAEFSTYYAARGDHIRNTAYLMCGDWHLANDLTQTTFTKIYRRWRHIERHDALDQYARRVLLRALLDERRRPWRREYPTADAATLDQPVLDLEPEDHRGDEQAARARAEAARLRTELETYKRLAEVGDISAVDYVRFSRGLEAQIAEQEAIAAEAGIPPVLRGMVGEHAMRRWAEIGDEVARKREIIRTVADIRLLPAGKGSRQAFGAHRLNWRWVLGPDAEVGDQEQTGTDAA